MTTPSSTTRSGDWRAPGRPPGGLLAALLLALSALAPGRVAAQAADELQQVGAHLRALGPIAPLPDSPLNRDAGDIAIIEHDGSSYDRQLPGGTPNYEARARVGLRFYETHPDDYDFLVVFTNFEFETGSALAFHLFGRNDVQGIGKPVGTVEAAPFGSRSRLKGWVDMASLERYRTPPYAIERGGPDFLRTLGVLAHEIGHQWLAEARYKVGEETFSDLLGADDVHWSYLLDSDGSFLYGADWQPNGDGTWSGLRVRQQYSALDLYLMGLLPREKVAPLTLLRSPGIDRHTINQEDETITAEETTTVVVDQVVAAIGPRQPDFQHSQKEFRLGFVLLAQPGSEPSLEDLEAVERIRRAFGAYFFALTHGVGWADTRLSATPPLAQAASPDLSRALAWLAARQELDGSWADSHETRIRDSATAVLALSRARAGLAALQRGVAWLRAAPAQSLDFQLRVALSLDPATLTPAERQLQLGRVLGSQNPDGGWGAARDFASDALDTALALRALKALGHPLDTRVVRGVTALAALAGPGGGWAAVVGGETSTVATAEVLPALFDWSDAPGVSALRAQGLAALLERQNPDGGFGSSPSTPQASALALEVLLRGGAGAELVEPLTAWLQQAQLADGSWAASPYQTALVVSVLSQALGANLVVPGDTLSIVPNPVREGELVRVVARVRNTGRATAPASVARLHDGDPAATPAVAEAPVPELAPGAEAEVTFDYPTTERAGRRTLHVVADATTQVLESREDDNTSSASLTVDGLLADLVVRPVDLSLEPAVPAVGEPATLTATVRNTGERAAGPFVVLARVSRPSGGTVALPLGQVPGLGIGDAFSLAFEWVPQEAGLHVIRVVADAGFAIAESDETNADATRPARVLETLPDGVQLFVASATATPPSLQELPQPIELRALVVNAGRADADTEVELRDASGESLGRVDVQVPGRGERVVALQGTLHSPGSRQLAVVVDPDWQVPEEDEYDNTLLVAYPDARTLDVEVAAATLSAAEVELGERVTVTVEIRNRGTRDVLSVPVQLAHVEAGAPLELARATLSLVAGESRTIELSWRASIVGDTVPLLVRADPFDNLVERREDNNAVPLVLAVRDSTQPNLTLSGDDVTLDPDPPIEGSPATLSALVRNTGGAPAGASLLRFVVGDPDRDGRTIGEVAVPEIAAGDSRRVAFDWPRVDVRGTLGLFAIADAFGAVSESNEDDNRAFRPFAAVGLPDLVLTGAAVRLVPAYPRESETVTIDATVWNLGGLPSVATALDVFEGDIVSRTSVGRLDVPALAPGAHALLSLVWTPAPPAGERTLALVLDPDSLVTEQDEGNNEVARRVVVQDADLFVSEPVFSPDGDGVKDATTLAWRAAGAVRVVVSNARGLPVRTLVADGAESGSATWDGRDERGVVAWDGSYTLSVIGEQGARLGSVPVVLDTNRSPLHDASPGRITVRNLSCPLPAPFPFLRGPAFMPFEDEVLYIVPDAQPGFPVGMLRASADGSYAYVAQDDWFRLVGFASTVSPDGQEVLVRVTSGGDRGNVYGIDLVTGERRSLGNPGPALAWSPDGQLLTTGSAILTRDGSYVATLWGGDWRWSPDGGRLARLDWPEDSGADVAQVAIVARDGAPLEPIRIPRPAGKDRNEFNPVDLVWRGDGKIVATLSDCLDTGGESPECEEFSLVVDPESRSVTRLGFVAGGSGWSPDGSRYLRGGELLLENGASLGPQLPPGAQLAPRSSVASFMKWQGDTSTPGSVCGGKFIDSFLVAPAANLAADLQLSLLPGGAGVLLRGTATDRNLERFQLDYASQADPASWHPIGASLDTPVLDDVLTAWVPPGPGSYVIRLSVSDLAGHTAVKTRSVTWKRVPVLANFTQSDYYLSPEPNGVKDTVTFRYTVVSPTRVDVRVVGPEPRSPQEPAGREVWRAAFEHATTGPQSFAWDGHDESAQVVADGRYTVFINDLPFRVEVDNTPPELGFRFGEPYVAGAPIEVSDDCTPGFLWTSGDYRALSSVAAERLWHVVDDRLESWKYRGQEHGRERVFASGQEPVFVAAPGSAGSRPQVLREDGHPTDLREGEYVLPYARRDQLRLEAWDLAGNHSEIAVERPAEAIFPLGAVDRDRCEVLTPALEVERTSDDGLPTGQPVTGLRPVNLVMQVGSSLRGAQQDLELVMQPAGGGAEHRLPAPGGPQADVIVPSFEALGIDPTLTYRARFTGEGETGPAASAPFVFSPCQQWLRAMPALPDDPDPKLHVVVLVKLERAVQSVTASLQLERPGSPPLPIGKLTLAPMDDGELRRFRMSLRPGEAAFFARLPELQLDCANRLSVGVKLTDSAGEVYPSQNLESGCQKLSFRLPEECRFGITLRQDFPGCAGSPDVLKVVAAGFAEQPARVTIETGPIASPTILEAFDFDPTPGHLDFQRNLELSVAGFAGDNYPVRGRVVPFNPALLPGADAALDAIVDRTPPVAEFLLPPEGGAVCLAANTTAPPLDVLARFDDALAKSVEPQASWRADGGDWKPLARACPGKCPEPWQVPVDRPVSLSWNAAALDSGEYELRLQACDRSGNRGTTTRRIFVTRDPPVMQVLSMQPREFSPNGDGLAEETLVTVRLFQAAALSARVHRGGSQGPLVRTLLSGVPQPATDVVVAWDGRGDSGQPLADGEYAIVFALADACGGSSESVAAVMVDTTPPEVAISEPTAGQRVSASIDVLGAVADLHLSSWELDLSCGGSAWTRLTTRTYGVSPGSFLARWDTSQSPAGECRLRLVAEDRARNRSPEVFATATVERGAFLESISASPEVFSPNGDGRRETATIGYVLARAARVFLEVRDSRGLALKTFEGGSERAAGAWNHVWDGLTSAATPAPEGVHVVWLRAEDPAVATVYEEKTLRLDLDRTPPALAVSRPVPDGFASPLAAVRGSVSDRNFATAIVSATPAGGGPVELARLLQGFAIERDMAPLGALGEGPHVLHVEASDAAENESLLEVPFFVDATPPRALIQSPAAGAVLHRGEDPVAVTGLATDDHLASWTLRFGEGDQPGVFTTIAEGTTGGSAIPLGSWDVRFLPDGHYTLSLVAADRGGLTRESRVVVELDGRPPTVAITEPAEGRYVTAAGPITGTAADAHLASWELMWSPGPAATAYQWSELARSRTAVNDGPLAEWSPLPADGVYTLRLTATDEVGQTSATLVTVTVDTTPPAPPRNLVSRVTRTRDGYGRVEVGWDPNSEPDLAGYVLRRLPEEWGGDRLAAPAWDDGERLEGRYAYEVVAEDLAGNSSAASRLDVLVDLTPPRVAFTNPAADASVSGAVDVRGTAWSADDFKEYRLLVSADETPGSWTLLRRSTLGVAAGRLGEWLALADGPHVLALEAEDTNGNQARVTRRVVVDTQPPEPPLLVAVDQPASPGDLLVPSWQPSASADVVGTLVYRNGHLANSTGIVLGDRRGFVVPGTSYDDPGLPDGEHCYRVAALDAAGNESLASNEICRTLDNRAPHALVVHPPDGTRFGFPVRVIAETPDLDVASVRFERRAAGSADWVAFGELRTTAPWETTLDPEPVVGDPLAPGPHALRAVATDNTGHTDPAPAWITVVYGDTTPPPAPEGLVAKVDGRDVSLSWEPVEATDLAWYRVYRDGERIADGVSGTQHADLELQLGSYRYLVTAVDEDGNESEPSRSADAVVYRVSLEQRIWPVITGASASVSGSGARPGTTVSALREGTAIAQAPASADVFRIDGVPLVPDGNRLTARGEDAAGNRSLPSDEVVLISNSAPGAVSGLEAEVTGTGVALGWDPVGDPDLAGYVVSRDGERLTVVEEQDAAASITASEMSWQAAQAWDANPATAWSPGGLSGGAWTITFPRPVLVEGVRLRFGSENSSNPGIPAAYRLLVGWGDHSLPVLRVSGNTRRAAEHHLPAPFLTTSLTVRLDSPGGLAEVDVLRLDVEDPGFESFLDEEVRDGRHEYAVTAIDRYGAQGEAGSVEAAVGDVDPPGPPTGLVVTPVGRDVHLTWNANPEPDVTGYVVLRDGARIATTPSPAWTDPARPNGTYVYTVLAFDAAGLESEPSSPALATVSVAPVPPPAPEIVAPTDAAHPITLGEAYADVAGRAQPGSTVSLEVNGQLRGAAPAHPGFRELPAVQLGSGDQAALSGDGRWAAWSEWPDAVVVQDLATGERRSFPHGGASGAYVLRFSPDASSLAMVRPASSGPWAEPVVSLALADGTLRVLAEGIVRDFAWSPDGTRLAVARLDGGGRLGMVELASGLERELSAGVGVDRHLRWSPDGRRLAYVRSWWDVAYELHVLELETETVRVLDVAPHAATPPSWSSDGGRLAWTTEDGERLRVRVQDVAAAEPLAEIAEPGADVLDPRYSPDGEWLSYVRLIRLENETLRTVHAVHQRTGFALGVVEPEPGDGPFDGHEWIGESLALRSWDSVSLHAPEPGWFVVRDVPLQPGENRLVARALDPTSGLASPDSDEVSVTVPEGAFADLSVSAEGLLLSPALPIAGRPAEIRVRVLNDGDEDAEDVAVRVRVRAPSGAIVLETVATLPLVLRRVESSLLVAWTPGAPGSYTLEAEVDPGQRIAESSEANNSASREIVVVASEGLAAAIDSDRASYPAQATAHLTLRIANAGTPFSGTARTTVEDATGAEVALVDERPLTLDWGRSVSYDVDWATRTTWAGRYRFVLRLRENGAAAGAAAAFREFDVEAGTAVLARVRPQRTTLPEGDPAGFALLVENRAVNTPLAGATARLRVQLDGAPGPARFETTRTLDALRPGGSWEAIDAWSAATPAGRYAVHFEVAKDGLVLAESAAFVTVEPRGAVIAGTLAVTPRDVLAGATVAASVTLVNRAPVPAPGYPVVVEVVSGLEATLRLAEPALVDLGPLESRELVLSLATGAVPPGRHSVRLRGGTPPVTLDIAQLVVHGAIAPPSPHAPQEGARVATDHPTLVVNDASSPEGAALRYEFELYGDAALVQPLPGARGIPETPSRTSWTVAARLAEDASYWWRARASDGFSTSAWSSLARFTVDAVDEPPSAPVPDTPAPGARVASRQPTLTVRNGVDPEGETLSYEFRVARDPEMTEIVAAQAGVAEGLGLTSWVVPVTLDEDARYFWSARAATPGGEPEDVSLWSAPVDFEVDTVNLSPSAPLPLRPVGGDDVLTLSPALVIENASDPEGDPLLYRFEIDVSPSLDSPERQESPELSPGVSETRWTPDAALVENTRYYWRAHASDGRSETPSALAQFFVDVTNEPPTVPTPLDPVDGRVVGTPTPSLCLHNATDPEDDALLYDLEVRDASGAVVAQVDGVPADAGGTTCAAVETPLAENQDFTWRARANDGELLSDWSAPAEFRVDAVQEPPSAPAPLLPGDGATIDERHPALVVANATSPDGLALVYTFELERVAADGSPTLVERVEGVAETPQTTSWAPSVELADGEYQWRARASDARQNGPWSATSRFAVLLDQPPSPPRDLAAAAGDGRVRLDWQASPEPDVTRYRIYRATTAGGPYAAVGEVGAPGFDDLGLSNGVTYYYVVTALTAAAESGPSNEAAARPEAPAVLAAEIRFDPAVIAGECLLAQCERRHGRGRDDDDDDDDRDDRHDEGSHGHKHRRPRGCPEWLYATVELPRGYDPATIDVSSLRAFGSVRADKGYRAVVDSDRDGIAELRVRFDFDDVVSHLRVGSQQVQVVGRAGWLELRGSGSLEVLEIAASLRMTPRTLNKRSKGEDVLAQLTFGEGVKASDVQISSVRLNGVVPVARVVHKSSRELKLKFDRAAVSQALPAGASVEVRVTGTIKGIPFQGTDHIRVIQ